MVMRFDDFVAMNGIAVYPVDRYPGLVVQMEVPPGWEHFDSAPGLAVWVCRSDPRADEFCANAVLTMHLVEAPLDAGAVFSMLVDQQMHSVAGCREQYRDLSAAAEGVGVAGIVAMEFVHDLGVIDSVCQSMIIATERETLIVQLTTSALRDSPVVCDPFRVTVSTAAAAHDDLEDMRRAASSAEREAARPNG